MSNEKWFVGSQNDGLCILNRKPSPSGTDVVWAGHKDTKHIACVDLLTNTFEEGRAHANLMAAAPELLEALRLAEATLAANLSQSDALPTIREAIKKAEGR